MPDPLVNLCRPLPTGSTLCILGAGFSGRRLASLAEALGIRVITTRRNPDPGSNALAFDSANNLVPPASAFEGVTHLLSTIPPGRESSDPMLRTLGPLLQQQPLRRQLQQRLQTLLRYRPLLLQLQLQHQHLRQHQQHHQQHHQMRHQRHQRHHYRLQTQIAERPPVELPTLISLN